ncbi:4-hydroxyphenylpyruvate dioxygenase-like protein [Anneissia japonica]|uniref:4-hydroxyphenylpyruvate dioxygenase-like protein n=1 Tax=Anneissia japonica TaxID=1529436 RepID=UPI001425B0CD|nr:4-hydroxyphenylpyruvate dioxygenase-like protein [Anneissia japonica]
MAAHMRFHHFKIFAENGWKFTQKMVNNLQFQLFAFKKVNDFNHWVIRNGTAIFVVTEHPRPSQVQGAGGDGLPCLFSTGPSSQVRCEGSFTINNNSDLLKDTRPVLRYNQRSSIPPSCNSDKFVYSASSGKNIINNFRNQSCNNINNSNYSSWKFRGESQLLKTQHEGCKSKSSHCSRRPASKQMNCRHLENTETVDMTSAHIQENNFTDYHEIGLGTHKLVGEDKQHIDSVFDVAFHVQNVEKSFEKAVDGGAQPVCEPTMIEDEQGVVAIASVRSCVGDVVHTLLNTKNYKGIFLPGFSEHVQYSHQEDDHAVRRIGQNVQVHFDHVTYACPIGGTEKILQWYENCFGMKRLKINSNEDDEEGFVVRGDDVGMRLKAMEYWRCNETGFVAADQDRDLPINFVVAEALPGHGRNQIETFLREHNGPGIQHIGLHTPDLVHTAGTLQQSGVEFIQPPEAYYTQVGKLDEILETGQEVETLQKHGILLDAEADAIQPYMEEISTNQRYLMQVFTKPLFKEDTFFLEYIQRCGATGFGAGNITALWRSVQQYMDSPSADNL